MDADNVFKLMGMSEKGLTKSLGFMLGYNELMLRTFLSEIGFLVRRFRLEERVQTSIEVPDEYGRTDIEVKIGNRIYLIVEGKIGISLPSKSQLRKYCNKLRNFTGEKRLCVITEISSKDWRKSKLKNGEQLFRGLSDKEIYFFSWEELRQKFFSKLNLSDTLNRQYEEYLEEMIMQNEILVVSADSNYGNEDPDMFRKLHLYWYSTDTIKKRHSYIALYLPAAFGEEQGINEIAKIIRYELCNLEQLGIPKDSQYYKNLKKNDNGKPRFYKLVLGEVVRLPRKIKKSRGKRVRNWTTTFEKLLKAEYADELL